MALFEKKKEPAKEAPASPEPKSTIDIIREMKAQNYSNNQIVEYLQRQGLKSNDIFDAMNQVEAGSAAGPIPESKPAAPAPMGPPAMPPMPGSGISKEQVEEISESIVDEKFEDFNKDFKKLTDWKDSTENKLVALEQKLADLTKSFDDLHKGVLGKIEEYDKGIVEVGTEIKALEKVFSKILPTLTENVSELSRITQKMKGSAKK